MAILMVRSTTDITEYYPVVPSFRTSVTGLALRSEDSLCRSSAFDSWCGFGDGRDESYGLVHVAAGLGSRREWCVG
jgi:hypothetical protein